ncbi:MAG: 50S ribosomal protein L29 [Chloroflexi bacterium]|nr:50S ribosomal protein L29 [Chloroflexota bacterium]
MSAKDLRTMTDAELNQKLREAYQELFNLRFRHATKQIKDTSRIRIVRRDIARIRTILRERQLAAEREGERK